MSDFLHLIYSHTHDARTDDLYVHFFFCNVQMQSFISNLTFFQSLFFTQGMESDAMQTDEPEVKVTERGEIINRKDGLPNLHPNFAELELHPVVEREPESPREPESQREPRTLDELIHDEDLPTSLIVTNLESSIFSNEEQRVSANSIRISLLWEISAYARRKLNKIQSFCNFIFLGIRVFEYI